MDEPGDGSYRSGYVALVGEPNAGKSTLMNAMLHQKLAIVSPKPQTTRRRTLGIVGGESFQMILLDTPGMLDPRYPLQRAMMRTVQEALGDANVACVLLDAEKARPDRLPIPPAIEEFRGPRIAALNKVDLYKPKQAMLPVLDAIAARGLFADVVPISALEGDGIDDLVRVLARSLPEGPPLYPPDQVTDQPERFFVAEMIREQVFLRFYEEIPYSVEVEIDDFRERGEGAKDYIASTLFVEQESQKAILIGRKGAAIRALGEAAREEIEAFLGRPVFLELRVKVVPKWRRDETALRRLGYRA
ncbi:MAG: GTPase Era [Candidatus Eisenbacteria bacterium]